MYSILKEKPPGIVVNVYINVTNINEHGDMRESLKLFRKGVIFLKKYCFISVAECDGPLENLLLPFVISGVNAFLRFSEGVNHL